MTANDFLARTELLARACSALSSRARAVEAVTGLVSRLEGPICRYNPDVTRRNRAEYKVHDGALALSSESLEYLWELASPKVETSR
jgi:hypothetical protein